MKIKYFCSAAAIALSVLMFSSCGGARAGDKAAWDGKELYIAEKYTEALESFLDAEKKTVRSFNEAELYTCIGNCYYQMADYEKCIEYQLKCLEVDPEYFDGWVNLGIAYRKSELNDKALSCYEVALNYDPENNSSVPLYTSLGSLYIEMGKPISAIEYLEKAEKLYPEKADIHAFLSIAYKMALESEKSDTAFQKAKELGYPKMKEIQAQLDKLEK